MPSYLYLAEIMPFCSKFSEISRMRGNSDLQTQGLILYTSIIFIRSGASGERGWDIIVIMKKRHRFICFILMVILSVLFANGCQVLDMFRVTPPPPAVTTPQLELNQITEIPTLPVVTATPTQSVVSSINYEAPEDIFLKVSKEMLPSKAYDQVVIFGTVSGFTTQTDEWGNYLSTGALELSHHSGTTFTVSCDDFCFYVDARKNHIPSSAVKEGSEIIVFGAAGNEVTDINADMIAVHTLAETPHVTQRPDMSSIGSNLVYTEYELVGMPQMNPIRIQGVELTAVPENTPTADLSQTGTNMDGSSTADSYDYGYYSYYLPTSTPNRPSRTATPEALETIAPTPTKTLNDLLTDRLNHTLETRSIYSFGSYGEKYAVYIEYETDQNRDPRHPTRAMLDILSNSYSFAEYWIPYVENPMFYNWGIVNYGGDWYMPLRVSVDIDPEPGVVDLIVSDRTLRSQSNYDEQKGYIRSFGYSIINRTLFYFYQKENGYGISIGLQDYDLGFDDIPFGYIGTYAEMVPFYSDDLITFFGHRDGKWYYVELGPDPNLPAGYYW